MYTSYIGKKFLTIYKTKENKPEDYSAKQFFEEFMFPIFFNDEQHLMHVGNSPFFQKVKDSDMNVHGSKSLAQLNNLRTKINAGTPSGSIYVGYGAEEIQATSSGQITSMKLEIDSEEMYASWIGQALGIGVNGGFVILIDEKEILLTLFNGWKHYRKFLTQTPKLKDKQIETWNGNWLNLQLNNADIENTNYSKIETGEVVGNLAIVTAPWLHVIFSLAKKYPSTTMIAYGYILSQTNTTLGFINVYLPEIKRMFELRDHVFINKNDVILGDKEIEEFVPFYRFNEACKFGTIGLKSIEPKGLREFIPKGTRDYAQGKDYKFTDEKSYTNFKIYKLWLITMLSKTELLKLASDVAKALIDLEQEQSARDKTKTSQTQSSKELFESKNLKTFIDLLSAQVKQENAATFKNLVVELMTMPSDNFPLFLTLIKFEYAILKHTN
jgi:hypothetical protein